MSTIPAYRLTDDEWRPERVWASDAVLGNAAFKIVHGRTPAALEWLRDLEARCAYRDSYQACWHRAAMLLVEAGLRPLRNHEGELEAR